MFLGVSWALFLCELSAVLREEIKGSEKYILTKNSKTF